MSTQANHEHVGCVLQLCVHTGSHSAGRERNQPQASGESETAHPSRGPSKAAALAKVCLEVEPGPALSLPRPSLSPT